jgi:hypothetical protein
MEDKSFLLGDSADNSLHVYVLQTPNRSPFGIHNPSAMLRVRKRQQDGRFKSQLFK